MKRCRVCNLDLPLTNFSKAPENRDKLQNICKPCQSAYYKEWQKARMSRTVNPVDEKKCIECGLVKPAAEFAKNKRHSTGLASLCKPCFKERYYDKEYFRLQYHIRKNANTG